jgi:hypothetical protein
MAAAGALFALGLLILILVNRLQVNAAKATAIEAQGPFAGSSLHDDQPSQKTGSRRRRNNWRHYRWRCDFPRDVGLERLLG